MTIKKETNGNSGNSYRDAINKYVFALKLFVKKNTVKSKVVINTLSKKKYNLKCTSPELS